jgi:hypothetical protein
MLSLNINNPIIERFFKDECQNDNNKFIDNLLHYVETYTIKQSVKQGFYEAKLQNDGQLPKQELKHILNEI